VRLFGWPARLEGVDRTLEFIALTIRGAGDIVYRAVESAIVPGGAAAFVRLQFDFTREGGRRLRSHYVVIYRYRDGVIGQQELYYDPSGTLEEL
jgi:ketosteroid isomerase-like protein